MYETIQQERVLKEPPPETLALRARDVVNSRLRTLERDRSLVLSSGARQVLRAPVVEQAEFNDVFNEQQAYGSLETIFQTLREEPRAIQRNPVNERTSVDVIRAIWKNFCKVPPFCSGR